jgi:predicted SAM-dependent methyltransferase
MGICKENNFVKREINMSDALTPPLAKNTHNHYTIQVSSDHYNFSKYMDKGRWNSCYHQIDEMISPGYESILEVGVGPGITSGILKRHDFVYETLDIDPDLHPDHIGSVTEMPFNDRSVDVIGCFQVLEHLPFEQFQIALNELFRVARKRVILSLPDIRPVWSIRLYVPRLLRKRDILFPRPFFKPREHIFNGQHYWEINKKGYSISHIRQIITDCAQMASFVLYKDYRVWEFDYHHFFVLKKNE